MDRHQVVREFIASLAVAGNDEDGTPPDRCFCYEDYDSGAHIAVRTPCNHVFGRCCLATWCAFRRTSNTCPVCRTCLFPAVPSSSTRLVERTRELVERARDVQRHRDNEERQDLLDNRNRMVSAFQSTVFEGMNQHGYSGGSLGRQQGENHGYASRAYDPPLVPPRTQQDVGNRSNEEEDRTRVYALGRTITNASASASHVSSAQDRIQGDASTFSFEFRVSPFQFSSTGLASPDRRRQTRSEDSNQRRAEAQLALRNPFTSASALSSTQDRRQGQVPPLSFNFHAFPSEIPRTYPVGPDRRHQAAIEGSNQRRGETQPTGARLEVPNRNEAHRPHENLWEGSFAQYSSRSRGPMQSPITHSPPNRNEADLPYGNPWEVFGEGRSLPDGSMQSTGTQLPVPTPREPTPPRRDDGQQE